MLSFIIIAPMVVAAAGLLRLRAEESAGRVESVLVTGSSRSSLLGGWTVVIVAQALVMVLLIGLSVGLGVTLGTGQANWTWELGLASLAYVPATLLVIGIALALFGLLPRRAALVWVVVVWITLALYLGGMLGLPDWAMALSPLYHTALVPAEDLRVAPLVVMTVAAVSLGVAGFLGFRRRDVVPGE